MPSQQALEIEATLRQFQAEHAGPFDLEFEREVCANSYERAAELPGLRLAKDSVAGVRCLRVGPPTVRGDFELVYLHGGGFCLHSAYSYHRMAGHFASHCQAEALLPDYSLAPEQPFPAALEECQAVVADRIARAGRPVALAGDSAGGNLTLSVLMKLRDEDQPMPFAAVLIAPWLDLTHSGASFESAQEKDFILSQNALASMAENYLQGTAADSPHASPLYGSLEALPPLFIQASEYDLLRDDSMRLADAQPDNANLRVELYPCMQHVFQFYAGNMPEADEALRQAAAFLKDCLPDRL